MTLITTLEQAEGGSRELDGEVWRVFGYEIAPHTRMRLARRYATASHWESIPSVTSSIDEAVALVREKLPGWFEGYQHEEHHNYCAELFAGWRSTDTEVRAFAKTAPLALCAALLRALESQP